MDVRGSVRTCVNLYSTFCSEFAIKQYFQVSFSGVEVGPFDGDVSWFSPGISYAWDQEYNTASLALIYHATSTSSEGDLRHLMVIIVSTTPDFTEKDSDFRSLHTWSSTERGMVNKVKESLIKSMPWNTKGTTAPHHPRGRLQLLHLHHRQGLQ